jgi:small subunit ribosomal protein S2
MQKITMRQMLEAGVHFGHRTHFWHPQMAPYIFGTRGNLHIINLERTLPMFIDALEFIGNVAANRGKILFVGTKPAAREIIFEEATRAGMPYVNKRWLGGMLTNYKTIRQSIKRLKDFEVAEACGKFDALLKKEKLAISREKEKLEENLSGIKNMGGIPDVLLVVDIGMEKIAVAEANRLNIPVVGIVDTNYNPAGIDYIIPGNDDATRAIRFYCHTIAEVIISARAPLIEAEKVQTEKAKVVVKKKVVKPAAKKTVTAAASVQETAETELTKKTTTVRKAKPETTPEKKREPKAQDTRKIVVRKAASVAKPASNDGEKEDKVSDVTDKDKEESRS